MDFLHEQYGMFAGSRERTLLDREDLGTRHLSVDRQKLAPRRSTTSSPQPSIATAGQATGYVFEVNVNFDPALDAVESRRTCSDSQS